MDKSREKMRLDKLSWEEFESLVDYFSSDPRLQAYLTISLESLARPQELLYRRIRDTELHDNYAKILLSEHGKEGVGLLQCIDSYPYLLKWLNIHPDKKNPDAFLFVNVGVTNYGKQLKPENVNKFLRTACARLGIKKPVTCYSLKRNGVTIRRLRGESDMEIQHAARWTSTKQLSTYDLSNQEEAFSRELEKRGLIPTTNPNGLSSRRCTFCNQHSGFGEVMCQNCQRPLDRTVIQAEIKAKDARIEELARSVAALTGQLGSIKEQLLHELATEVLNRRNASALKPRVTVSRRQSEAGTGAVFPLAGAQGLPR